MKALVAALVTAAMVAPVSFAVGTAHDPRVPALQRRVTSLETRVSAIDATVNDLSASVNDSKQAFTALKNDEGELRSSVSQMCNDIEFDAGQAGFSWFLNCPPGF